MGNSITTKESKEGGILFLTYALRDIKRQKVRSTFAILGIAISILLMTITGSLSDSMAYSVIDQATYQVGSADIAFTKELEADFNFNPYFEQDLIKNKLDGKIEEIDFFFPRIFNLVQATYYSESLDIDVKKTVIYYGINTTLEQNSEKMGDLLLCEYDSEEERFMPTEEVFVGPILTGHCILTDGAAKLFNITEVGGEIDLTYTSNNKTVIVDSIVKQNLRFSSVENSLIIEELEEVQNFIEHPGEVNYVMATLADRESVYDARNIDKTIKEVRLIGEKIQDAIGFEYTISLPKILQFEANEQSSLETNMMFGFLTFFSLVITGILINSILSTSIEERIREFGVLRVLGGRKAFCFKLVLTSGFLMAVIGTTIGTLIGALGAPPFLEWYFDTFDLWSISINFLILPATIIKSIVVGIGVTTVISMLPAQKAGSTELTKAIDPSRSNQEEKYHIKQEGTANTKLMVIGLAIGLIGIIMFLIFPRIISTFDMQLITGLMMFLLILVLMGLVLATLGIIPLLQTLIARLMKPLTKRYHPIFMLSLKRYRRRNTGTTVMFSLTFAFIFFVSTMLQMREANSRATIEFQHGSDIVISNTGTTDSDDSINMGFYDEVKNFPNVKAAAPTFHNTIDITLAAGALLNLNEGELSIEDIDLNALFGGGIDKPDARISDMGDYANYYCNLIGVNEEYENAIRNDLLIWDEDTGSSDQSLNDLYTTSNSCIIAKCFADALHLEVGDPIKIMIQGDDYYKNTDDFTPYIFNVVGVSGGMPGFFNFRSAEIDLMLGAGVMLNLEDYGRIMEWGDPNNSSTIVDKIFIKTEKQTIEEIQELKKYIEDYYGDDFSFEANENASLIEFMESMNNTMNTILQTVLFFSVIVSLFGLISAMYSTLVERMFEIGILRAMGLKSHEVKNLMIAESTTIMLSAGTCGMGIGIWVAYLLQKNTSIITQMPTIVALDIGTLASTFITSVVVCVLGMMLITRRIRKWSIVEIIRNAYN